MPDLETPPAPPSAEPASPAPAPLSQSFDQAFPDDGLDTPPEPAKEAAPASPPSTPGPAPSSSTSKSTVTPTSKDATAAGSSEASKASGTKETGSSAPAAPKPGAAEFSPPQVAKPNELRTWARTMGARAQQAEAEVQKLHSRIAQLEQGGGKSQSNGDVAKLQAEIAELKKQAEVSENSLHLADFRQSQEYLTKYEEPYQNAIAAAYQDVRELIAFDPNPEDPDSPIERPATQADFDEVYSLQLGKATQLAKQKFGDAAPIVLHHRERIRDLAKAAFQAVEKYKKEGGEIRARSKAEEAAMREEQSRQFHAAVEGHGKRMPELFLEREGDEEGNQLLAKGREFAQGIFGGSEGLTPAQVAFRDALGFARLSAWPRVLRDNKRLSSEVAELKKTIDELRGSAPGAAPAGTAKKDESGYVPFDQAFDALPG